ncbi:MAG: magnesium chelatase family protein, partial [Sediminicola sp.]
GISVFGVDNIKEVIDFFNEEIPLEETIVDMESEFYEHLSNPE